jgi:hypothetical protein
MAVTSSSYPPLPPTSFEQVCSSSSFESLTSDPKGVLDLFLGGEVIGSRLNFSLGVGGYVHIFNQWDGRVGKGDVVVKHASLFSFNNCSLVTGSDETYHCCVTWSS